MKTHCVRLAPHRCPFPERTRPSSCASGMSLHRAVSRRKPENPGKPVARQTTQFRPVAQCRCPRINRREARCFRARSALPRKIGGCPCFLWFLCASARLLPRAPTDVMVLEQETAVSVRPAAMQLTALPWPMPEGAHRPRGNGTPGRAKPRFVQLS